MKTFIKIANIAIFIGITFFTPSNAISCTICTDCMNSQAVNSTCQSGYDTCMKIDMGSYIVKQCGQMTAMCSKDGWKSTNPSVWARIQQIVGSTQADAELILNINSYGRTVLNCCNEKDYCNTGTHKTLSFIAVIAMLMVFTMA